VVNNTIKSISISNFKFFRDETIELKNKNALIYGENGTGKSSLYYALYSKINNKVNISEFKNRDAQDNEEFKVDITLDNGNLFDNTLSTQSYFISHSILHKTLQEKNFFETLIKIYISNFSLLMKDIDSSLKYINDNLQDKSKKEELIVKRMKLDEDLQNLIEKLTIETNSIFEQIEESISISFDFEVSNLDFTSSLNEVVFSNPKVFLKINEIKDKHQHFNEAVLKIVSISIYLVLINIEDKLYTENRLKLLVLDDLLLSIDMGNRLLISKYVYEKYLDFQKIILTHNIYFYSFYETMIRHYNEEGNWNKFELYKSKISENIYEAKICSKNDEYLVKATKELTQNNLDSAGNYLRKELEKIVRNIINYLQIGKIGQLEDLLKSIKSNDKYFIDTQKIIRENLTNNTFSVPNDKTIDTIYLNSILGSNHFIKDIVLNKLSHSCSTHEDIYRSELEIAKTEIEKLKKEFKRIKDNS
jgi:hypothetical protein